MTDRIQILTVALDSRMRTDDAKDIIDAIMMIRGVADVTYDADVEVNKFLFQATQGREAYLELEKILRERLLGK